MKQITVSIMAAASLAISSCTPGGGTTTPTTPALNATETSLIGTWHLKKQVLVKVGLGGLDTTYTGYNNSWYVTFKSNSYPGGGSNWKEMNKAFLSHAYPTNNATNMTHYWYYDETSTYLNLIVEQYKILSLTPSAMTLRITNSAQQTTLHFEK